MTVKLRILTLFAVFLTAIIVAGCGGPNEDASSEDASVTTAKETSGKELVDLHCVSCHLAPEPTDLSKEYWLFALHYMGNYVGMKGDEFADMRMEPAPPEMEPVQDYTKRYFLYDSNGYFRDLYPFKQYIPSEPLMTKAEWLRMREYFVDNASSWTEMEMQEPKAPLARTFKPVIPNLDLEPNGLVLATLVDDQRRRIYVGGTVIDDWVGGGERREGFEAWDDMVVFDLDTGKRIGHTNLASPYESGQ